MPSVNNYPAGEVVLTYRYSYIWLFRVDAMYSYVLNEIWNPKSFR